MNPITSFDPTAIGDQLTALARLASSTQNTDPDRTALPRPGRLAPAPLEKPALVLSAGEIHQRLATWIGNGEVTGWLLTTEELVVLETGGRSLPNEPLLAAELHRPSNGLSLNLRHTPRGWLWEELSFSPENSAADSFVEDSTCLVKLPSDPPSDPLPKREARYEVEWRLTPAPDDSPATFRPARSRFVGWA